VAPEVGEHLELASRQFDRMAVALHAAGTEIHANVRDLEHRGFTLAGCAPLCAYPREQLIERVRLGDIAVRAAVEPFDALLDEARECPLGFESPGSASEPFLA
jgi:hypothetical protein